jgi:hypothetical protein
MNALPLVFAARFRRLHASGRHGDGSLRGPGNPIMLSPIGFKPFMDNMHYP